MSNTSPLDLRIVGLSEFEEENDERGMAMVYQLDP